MILVVTGLIGSGKTITLTALAKLCELNGYKIYSNYQLKNFNYENINLINDLFNLPQGKKFVALDEYWLQADSRESQTSSNKVNSVKLMQSRKILADVGITAQDFGQIDIRIRQNTSFVLEPKIVLYDLETGKPLLLEITVHNLATKNLKPYKFVLPTIIDNLDICECYDTFQVIEKAENPKINKRENIIKKYWNYKKGECTINELCAKIYIEENLEDNDKLSKGDCHTLAQYIINERENNKCPY